jgi:hypothetical protein
VNRFEAAVSALCYTILRERCPDAADGPDFPHNRTVRFVLDQHGRMPDYLRMPFALVTLAFDASSVVRHGRRFRWLPHDQRWRQVIAWRNAPLGPCRDLMKFYESFVVFHWHSIQRADAKPVSATREWHEAAR